MNEKSPKSYFTRVLIQLFYALRSRFSKPLKNKGLMVGTGGFEPPTPTTPFSTGEKQKNKHIKRLSFFFLIAAYCAVVFVASLKLERIVAKQVNDIFSANP